MSETIVHLNGKFLPIEQAAIPVLDRGFLFGDGVYEVIPVYGGRLFRLDQHLLRLAHSLDAVRIDNPHSLEEWHTLLNELVPRNGAGDQSLYLQITRGVALRNLAFPAGVTPTVFVMATPVRIHSNVEQDVDAIVVADTRWLHCDIKAITMMPAVLMRQQAIEHGAAEAIMLRDGLLTEFPIRVFRVGAPHGSSATWDQSTDKTGYDHGRSAPSQGVRGDSVAGAERRAAESGTLSTPPSPQGGAWFGLPTERSRTQPPP